jgi:hypothetical protein
MPGRSGSENRRLAQAVTLRMSDDLAQGCAELAAMHELSLAGWLRCVATNAVASRQTPSAIGCESSDAEPSNTVNGRHPLPMAVKIDSVIPPTRRRGISAPRKILPKPKRHIADLVEIAQQLADLDTLLADIRRDQAISLEPINDEQPIHPARLSLKKLSGLVTSFIERDCYDR